MRKYWPKEKEAEVEKTKPTLSIGEDFDLLTKKKETELRLESIEIKLEDIEGKTEDLRARCEVALEQIKVLGEKLERVESIAEVDKAHELATEAKNRVISLLDQNEPFRRQQAPFSLMFS